MKTLDVETPHGQAKAHLHLASKPRAGLILGHGAGGAVSSEDLATVKDVALEKGFSVAIIEQPYRVAGRRSPAPARQLDAAWIAAVDYLQARELARLRLPLRGALRAGRGSRVAP